MKWLYLLLILTPFLCGVLCLLRALSSARTMLQFFGALFVALIAVLITAENLRGRNALDADGLLSWFGPDNLGLVFMWIVVLIYVAVVGHLLSTKKIRDDEDTSDDPAAKKGFTLDREALYPACLSLSAAMIFLCVFSRHLGMIWMAMLLAMLLTVPLIATGKEGRRRYLLLCAVAGAIILSGNFLLAGSFGSNHVELKCDALCRMARLLDPVWLRAGCLCMLVGYGTILGLFPMHGWVMNVCSSPNANMAAYISGTLSTCALLAILRVYTLLVASGQGGFATDILLLLGLLTVCAAGVMMILQLDYKLLLACSSLSAAGVACIGFTVGAGVMSLLFVMGHALVKTALLMLSGNIAACAGSSAITEACGIGVKRPTTSLLLLFGVFCVTCFPPCILFYSEFAIVLWLFVFAFGHPYICILFLAGMFLAACGLIRGVMIMVYSPPRSARIIAARLIAEKPSVIWPALLIAAAVLLGIYLPPSLTALMVSAAAEVGLQ